MWELPGRWVRHCPAGCRRLAFGARVCMYRSSCWPVRIDQMNAARNPSAMSRLTPIMKKIMCIPVSDGTGQK